MRVYEFRIPPGAVGGGSGDILTERKPEATTMSIHPSGHFFVVGYDDGCFAFWAVEDEDQPLTARTVDGTDVNIVNPDDFEARMEAQKRGDPPQPLREPIFKLSWSGWPNSTDPRGGNTALNILGGLVPSSSPGLSVFYFPPFNPSEPAVTSPTSAQSQSLPPHFRKAMRESTSEISSCFYYSKGIVQDFHLVSRDNPHFSGSYNAFAILLVSESSPGTKVVEAFEFPPPKFATPHNVSEAKTPLDGTLEDLESTLKDMQLNDDPKPLVTPFSLYQGNAGALNGTLHRLERETYERILDGDLKLSDDLLLRGGVAWSDETKLGDLKMSKVRLKLITI